MKHISEIYLMGKPLKQGDHQSLEPLELDVRRVLPPSIGQLQHLIALSILN